MHSFHPDVLDLYRSQYGIASRKQLCEAGLTYRQIEHLVASLQLAIVHDGVYRLAAVPESFESQCASITLADDEVAISHQSAGKLWGLRQMQSVRVHVTVSHTRQPFVAEHVRVHRSGLTGGDDWHVRDDGIRVTSVARTLFDLAGVVSPTRLESALEHALRQRLVTMPDLWAVARRLARRGRSGSGRFVLLLNSRPTWLRPVDSNDELILEKALVASGLPQPIRQHKLQLPNAVPIHPDLAWPAIRWAVEVDHVTWHGGSVATMNDNVRDRQLRMIGWEVERVTDLEIKEHLDRTTHDLAHLYRLRCKAFEQ
jgi:very-short-patch-repair endonuclease